MLIPRSDFQVQSYASVFYVMGGCIGNQTVNGGCPSITNRLESFDTQSGSWAELSPSPTARTQYSAAMVGSRIFYVGGRDVNGNVIPSVDVYDVAAAAWSTLPDQGGVTSRSNAAAFAINGLLYVAGGYDNDYNSLNSTIALNTSVASASQLLFSNTSVPAKPVSAGDCGGVSIAGFGYVFAGFSSVPANGFCFPLNSLERYSPLSNSWTLPQPPSPMQNRGDPAYAVVADLLFVMGGEGKLNPAVDCFAGSSLSIPINSVEFYNVSSGNWTAVTTDALPVSRFRFSGNAANSRIYNIGGQAGEVITNSSADPVNPYEDSGYWPVVSLVEALDVSAIVNGTSGAVRQRAGSAGMLMLMAVMVSVIGMLL